MSAEFGMVIASCQSLYQYWRSSHGKSLIRTGESQEFRRLRISA